MIAAGTDGRGFEKIWTLNSTEIQWSGRTGTRSLERFCLRHYGDRWHLWSCWLDETGQDWEIWHMSAEAPDQFEIATATRTLTGRDVGAAGGVKDPVVIEHEGRYLMYFVGWATREGPASTYVASSNDCERVDPYGSPVVSATGWAAAEARLSDVLRLPDGRYLGMLDHAPTRIKNTVEHGALLIAEEPFAWRPIESARPWPLWSDRLSRRYPSSVRVGAHVFVYHERELTTGAHELGLVTVPWVELVQNVAARA